MSPHPDPRGRPVAACLKPNHLHRAREIAQGVCRQGWAYVNLSQTALVSLTAATQIRRVKGDTELRVLLKRTPHRQVHFLFTVFQSEEHRNVYVENNVSKSMQQN